MITANMELISTAPAAISLAFFAKGWNSWVTKFTVSSMAVFRHSVTNTTAQVSNSIAISSV